MEKKIYDVVFAAQYEGLSTKEATAQLLVLCGVVGQSEQLKCGNPNPPCMPNIKYGMLECCNCQWGE